MAGSSALATTVASGQASTARRTAEQTVRISPTRSSWSRDKFSSTNTSGQTSGATDARCGSSTSSTACPARGAAINAPRWPSIMFAPVELLATASPAASSATVIMRVVVVLPLVPVTSAIRRPAAEVRSADGRSSNASRPPITAPSPRPVVRDNHDATRPSPVATLAGT
jgi:hypothetical protein